MKDENLEEIKKVLSSFLFVQELLEKLVGPQKGHMKSALNKMEKRDYWFNILVYNVGTVAKQIVYTANDVRPATKEEMGRNIVEVVFAALSLAGVLNIDVAPHMIEVLEKYIAAEWKNK